jgi:DNA polymerase III subunit gamma/tau
MGQALYRKYRSHTLNEIVGQEHITTTLKKALKSGRISHAYLFSGPRGVGKTSIARILAHEVNKLPYSDESLHLDIIEIDAASNRRIDEIRDLRERVHITPTSAKYKVYIIDEVHMLTREAFNALLKTLEEPPAHCIFILATTEAHKLPETIVSRTQRFNFKPVDDSQAINHLGHIAKREKISIDREALALLAVHGGGSFRDSIGMLDQLSASGRPIDAAAVRQLIGLPPAESINKLLAATVSGQPSDALATLDKLKEQGANPSTVAKQLSGQLRQNLLSGNGQTWTIALLKELLAVPASPRPQDQLELSILEAAAANQASGQSVSGGSQPAEEPAIATAPTALEETVLATASNKKYDFDLAKWPEVVDRAKLEAASLYTALRLAEPRLGRGGLVLAFKFPLHHKKINQARQLQQLETLIASVTGVSVKVTCEVDKDLNIADRSPRLASQSKFNDKELSTQIETISNIFGTTEVLES